MRPFTKEKDKRKEKPQGKQFYYPTPQGFWGGRGSGRPKYVKIQRCKVVYNRPGQMVKTRFWAKTKKSSMKKSRIEAKKSDFFMQFSSQKRVDFL